MSVLDWPTDPAMEVRPVTDLVRLALIRRAQELREHELAEHPSADDASCHICRGHRSYLGARTVYVLRALAEAEMDVRTWKDRCAALADHALELSDGADGLAHLTKGMV